MFLSRMFRLQLPALGGPAVAALALMLAAEPAAAQPPPRPPAVAKGYETTLYWQDYWQRQGRQAASAPRPQVARPAPSPQGANAVGAVEVVVSTPAEPAPFYVDIRGPDGQVRTFPLEGGREAVARRIIVRPGETATIRIAAAPPVK